VYEETQHQDRIEACGYRSATWRIFRALKSNNQAKVLVGESAITTAPFFESAGRQSKLFSGPQQGNKVILTVGKPECRGKGGKSKSATQGERLGYLVQGQSKGQRGTGIPGAQSMHLYG
jgi:hypothetical protein